MQDAMRSPQGHAGGKAQAPALGHPGPGPVESVISSSGMIWSVSLTCE
jgi:hypothetical protein